MRIPGSVFFEVRVGKSRIHGKGLYAQKLIPAKRKIGSLAGEVISKKAARQKAQLNQTISIVELWNGKALDASQSNALRCINHSCQPNTYMRTIGNHVEFYALRSIKPGDELTCNYGATHHNGTKKCKCGAPSCKGFI